MKPTRLALIVLFLFFTASFSLLGLSQTLPASRPALTEIEQKAIVAREMIFHRKYDEALQSFKTLAQDYPTSLTGTFGQMAVWQAKMFENYDFPFDKEFEEVSLANKKLTEKVLDDPDAQAWELFLAGAGSGLRSFNDMRKGSAFKALGEANNAKKGFERALQKDPSFSDAYLGLGMYDFWRSVFTNQIKFFPFFSDKRAQGLSEMDRANKEGRVIGSLGDICLAFSYYKDRNVTKAIPPLENILKKYPESIIAKNLLTSLYLQRGSFPQAHALIDSVLKSNPEITVAQYFKAYTFYRENNLAAARKTYEAYLATKPTSEWASFALYDLGMISLKEGNESEAYEEFKKAYRLNSNNVFALRQLQALRKKEGRFGK